MEYEEVVAPPTRKSVFKRCSSSLEEGTLAAAFSCSSPSISLARKVGAEFVGTFILIFAAVSTAIVNKEKPGSEGLLGLAVASALAVVIVIQSTSHISGAHLNPSVTIAFAALHQFPWKHVPLYIVTQVFASLCAAFAVKTIFDTTSGGGVTVPSCDYARAFVLEFIITFILIFVVTAVATDTRAVGELTGITIGATVMLNILIAGEITGASMNPARTLGPAIVTNNFTGIWVYLTAPIIGGLAGAATYSALKLPEQKLQSDTTTGSTHKSLPQ